MSSLCPINIWYKKNELQYKEIYVNIFVLSLQSRPRSRNTTGTNCCFYWNCQNTQYTLLISDPHDRTSEWVNFIVLSLTWKKQTKKQNKAPRLTVWLWPFDLSHCCDIRADDDYDASSVPRLRHLTTRPHVSEGDVKVDGVNLSK